MLTRRFFLALVGGTGLLAPVVRNPVDAAAATPEPGGANQVAGIEGNLSSTLFNGQLRLRKMSLRAAAPADNLTSDFVVFEALVSNGTSKQVAGYFNSSIVDADGVSVAGHSAGLWNLQQAGSYKLKIDFHLPPNFVPVKIVLIPTDPKFTKAFRINLKAGDAPRSS
jgi:hypothetical protein